MQRRKRFLAFALVGACALGAAQTIGYAADYAPPEPAPKKNDRPEGQR